MAPGLFPESLRIAIAGTEGFWSEHAADNRDRLDLSWSDVEAVAGSAESFKKQRDPLRPGAMKYAVVGRDTHGRRLYMAGKIVQYEGRRRWKVITIHEAD